MNIKKNIKRNKFIIIKFVVLMSIFNNIMKSILIILILKMMKDFKLLNKLTRSPENIFLFNRTFIESHRGMNREFTENTIEAFERAIYYKLESIELDVWLTKDYIPVIHHGFGEFGELYGIYDTPGNITNLTLKELSSYRTIRDGLKLPTLKEVLTLTKNKIFLNIEIKDPRIDITFSKIMNLIEEYDFFDQFSLSSFFHDYYYKVKKYNKKNKKNIIFGFLYNKYTQYDFDYSKRGSSLNIYWADATKTVCDFAHLNNMAVLVWFDMVDVETIEIYSQLIENGADIICSNDPLLARKYVRYNNMKKKYNNILDN